MPGCNVWVPKHLTESQKILANSLHINAWEQPVMDYAPVFNTFTVEKAMEEAAIWIFTSSRTVRFMATLLKNFPNKAAVQLYVVGSTTAKALEDLGYTIKAKADYAEKLLLALQPVIQLSTAFFCNADRMDFLPNAYSEVTHFREVVIYGGEIITTLTPPKTLEYIVALSPKTIEAIYNIDPFFKNLPVVSIGKTTTAWLRENGINPIATCEHPSIENCFIELQKQKTDAVKK